MMQTEELATQLTNSRGRQIKFTPERLQQIRNLVERGKSREEIAELIGVTVGSLQVTCSRLGISLRRIISPNGSRRHVRIAHVGEQKEVSQPEACGAPVGKFAITMRCHGIEQASDIPLSLAAIGGLALEATSRDLTIAELVGQSLVATINKDMIHKILRD